MHDSGNIDSFSCGLYCHPLLFNISNSDLGSSSITSNQYCGMGLFTLLLQ